MNWEQIETSWAAMKRRLRLERREPEDCVTGEPQQRLGDMAELGPSSSEPPEQRGPAFARQVR